MNRWNNASRQCRHREAALAAAAIQKLALSCCFWIASGFALAMTKGGEDFYPKGH